ncbi:MAG TPA: hypothetical protein PKY35_13105 [Candidatus Hydrogenedentes bacterium]|nr:hypothetical protein [Candidatus Hydrogenedentota bacterium]HOL77956.1 hypothetical protein [Candidatus Hydrogenedentota bacterium]
MAMQRNEKGAALLIVVFLLLIVVLLSLTFYTASRTELRVATSTRDSVQAQFAAEAGAAVAMAFLRHDFLVHPTVTSLDHAWKTYFNGAWFIGKPAWQPNAQVSPRLSRAEYETLGDRIYIPRFVDPGTGTVGDFVIASNQSQQQRINDWADVDLDEDGYKDAMWIPLAMERIADDDGLDNDLDGSTDEPGELAIFLYYDETADRVFLTAPFVVDYTGDGVPDPLPNFTVTRADGRTFTLNPNPGSPDIDGRDNNYDFVVDNATTLAIDETKEPVGTFYRIAPQYFGTPNGRTLVSTGEPVCDIVGRYAVLITDEASKANLNTAHGLKVGMSLEPSRALNEGLGPHEYDLRVLPQLGTSRAKAIAEWRFGAQEPIYGKSFPGYGLIDDNGDAFWRAINGLDDDGDGLYDNGVFSAGFLEGIDEPQEYRLFKPYSYIADDGVTVDSQRSDRVFSTREGVKDLSGIAGGIFSAIRNLVTVNSADSNDRYQYYDRGGAPLPLPTVSGRKLDYNYAFPGQIASALINDWPYRPSTFPFALGGLEAGLRQEGVSYVFPNGARIPFDGELRAYQLGVDVVDNRDLDYVRTTLTTAVEDPWAPVNGLRQRRISYTFAGVESIRINEIMVRATRRVEAEAWTEPGNNVLFPPNASQVQFDPNRFSGPEFDKADFDVRRRVLPLDRVIEAFNGNVPVGIGTEWPGGIPQSNEPPAAVPFGPCLSVMGRLDAPSKYGDGNETNDQPTPPHIGEPSYVAFQAPCQRPGDDGYTDYRIGATKLRWADYWENGQVVRSHEVPNLVQWRFGPGPGLPPGRYYLLANTTKNGNADTATVQPGREGHMRFTFKYGRAGDDIVYDAIGDSTGYIDFLNNDQGLTRTPIVGTVRDANGIEHPTGWVFLPGLAEPDTSLTGPRAAYGNRPEFEAYTVVIPPYAANSTEQEYLYVAIWKDEDPDEDLVINFFEFSQEPDHEYVEIVHAGAPDPNLPPESQYVDLSGWQLQVGSPGGAGGEDDHRLFTIPDGTKIAAGGSLLLTVDKFDYGAHLFSAATGQYATQSILHRNGIGMCATNNPPLFPLFGIAGSPLASSITVPPFPTANPSSPINAPIAPSIFYRDTLADFVDRNGDGAADVGTTDDAVESSAPFAHESYGIANVAQKPWDRIVQLQNAELEAMGVGGSSLDALARLLLRGGVFPNYPDEDGADNDDDNAVLTSDEIDNNGNGIVDEPYEGVDEGRYLRESRRAGNAVGVPGGFNAEGFVGLTNGTEPPEWKEFIERRYFPGDCVVVTLYQGLAADNRVVDRVTYTQRDVENRAINDTLACPYVNENGTRATLDPRNPYMWPDNTMGVDFYRSLERKHPLYTGDRFGTTNRWEATDGNYDDWDSGMGPAWLGVAGEVRWDSGYGTHAYQRYAHSVPGSPLRMNFFQRAFEDKLPAEAEDVRTAQFQNVQFSPPRDERPVRILRDPTLVPYWHLPRAVVRNRPYSSPGELVRLPHFTMTSALTTVGDVRPPGLTVPNQLLVGRAPHLTDPTLSALDIRALLSIGANCSQTLSCATAEFYPIWPRPETNGVGSPAEYGLLSSWDRNAGKFPRVWTPIFLFNLGDGVDGAWVDNFGPVPNIRVQANYLLNPPTTVPPGFANLTEWYTSLRARWPLVQRPVMYVASNASTFEPSQNSPDNVPHATWNDTSVAEALFVWDINDGVENGWYDLYLATADDLTRLDTLTPAQKQSLFTPNTNGTFQGTDVLDAARNTAPGQLGITVAVYTDRDGNRRCWKDDRYPLPGNLNTDEMLGSLKAAQPNTEGLIYFGRVRVENNYLAVFLRNWAKGGALNRFSRVILTGVERTPGKININTVDTRNEGGDLANVLSGVPGILARNFTYNPTTGQFSYQYYSESDYIGPGVALAKTNRVLFNRPVHPDGRYYDLLADLLTTDVTGSPQLAFTDTLVADTAGGNIAAQYEEKVFRFSRMMNLITTRSDLFEIYALGQSGFVSNRDLNGDGRIDFRNDFVVTGESKLRTVYER